MCLFVCVCVLFFVFVCGFCLFCLFGLFGIAVVVVVVGVGVYLYVFVVVCVLSVCCCCVMLFRVLKLLEELNRNLRKRRWHHQQKVLSSAYVLVLL